MPIITSDKDGIVELSSEDDQARILYTLDGSIPTTHNAYAYLKPVKITKTTLLRAVAIKNKFPGSKILSQHVGTDIYQKAQTINKKLQNGLKYEYYEGYVQNTDEIRKLTRIKTGITQNITNSLKISDLNYAFNFTGYIKVPEDGVYTFYLSSNDGSKLYLNNELAINNDGAHGNREESVVVSLNEGYHKLSLLYFQLGGGQNLVLEWSGENFERVEIPATVFYH